MKRTFLISFLLVILASLANAADEYAFRVYLKDKGDSGFSISRPEAFLSDRTIDKRQKAGIPITYSDLPISSEYIQSFSRIGAHPVVWSKWLQTVVVESNDSSIIHRLRKISFVDSVKWVWSGDYERTQKNVFQTRKDRLSPDGKRLKNYYGYAEKQIRMLRGDNLHKAGYQGQGMRIAVLDAGFQNVNRINAFNSMNLIGTYNVVAPTISVFDGDEHGTKALSCLAANLPGFMVGTAPKASYLLIRCENSDSEYPIEEDYWARAAEYADSVSVDVISSSLGYFSFDADELSYQKSDLNGQTAQISKAAHIASEKGILVFCSAGNEGDGDWEEITFPGDAKGIVTVGSVDRNKKHSSFSSVGYTADQRVKPDVVAMGTNSCIINYEGKILEASGTSFATPILAGAVTCLWQALPRLNSKDIIRLVCRYSSNASNPNKEIGFGIPNLYKALKNGRSIH